MKGAECKVIGIVDTGISNVLSIARMVERVGGVAATVRDGREVERYRSIILPGVGHFDEGVRALRVAGMLSAINDLAHNNQINLLGICLGMQLLCRNSEEGNEAGLSLIDAEVRRLNAQGDNGFVKVPHMGWNTVTVVKENPVLHAYHKPPRFYFVHSYCVVPHDSSIAIGTTNYGGEFCSAISQGNVFGVQFHPEKSHTFGLDLIKRFVEIE